jgi:fermentation-respiration switch protein FrsA (DUF1100 family)
MTSPLSDKGTVFFPDPNLVGTPADVNLNYDDVWFTTADGIRLHGWWIPQPDCPTILWFHGNGGNISHRLENIDLLWRLVKVQIFIFDYREYGRSEGEISRAGTFLDAAAAYRCAIKKLTIPAGDLILFGRSLGSALALDQAVKNPVRALILESAFTSSRDMAALYAPFLGFWEPQGPMYDNLSLIPNLKIPVLIYAAAPEPKELYILPGAHHNDLYDLGGDTYISRWRKFIHRQPSV